MEMEKYLKRQTKVITPVEETEISQHRNTDNDNGSSDDSNNSGTKITTNKKRINYKQKHKTEWEKEFPWLTYNESKSVSYCIACRKPITSKISHLRRHSLTVTHNENTIKSKNTPTLDQFSFTPKTCGLEKEARKAEYKCMMFLHEHNLPFSLMEHLTKFLGWTLPDSEIAKMMKCSRTKATELTTDCILQESLHKLRNQIDGNYYSLIIDETTDISVQKSLVVLIRYWDGNKVKDKFLSLIRLNTCTADSIFTSLCKVLEDNNIERKNLIGFAADNAAVMMGQHNGVKAKLKQINPNIFVLGCTCHSIHLCASAAAMKLPKSVEELARNIFNHFSNSSNRSQGLGEFQIFTNIKPCKMLHPSQTRWLSLQVELIYH